MTPRALRQLRQVSGVRQVEIAELMISTNNFSAGYAEALVLGTPKDQLVSLEKRKEAKGLSPERLARMQEEMVTLERDLKAIGFRIFSATMWTRSAEPYRRMIAYEAFFFTRPEKEVFLPVCQAALREPNPGVQRMATQWLTERFEEEAKKAGIDRRFPEYYRAWSEAGATSKRAGTTLRLAE